MIKFYGKIKGKREEVEKLLDCFKKACNHQFVVSYEEDVEEEVERAKNFYSAEAPHFWNVSGVEVVSQGMEKGGYFVNLKGLCNENLEDSLLKKGAQKAWEKYKALDWFKGISLEDVHEKFPELKVELFSEDPEVGFSEHILVTKDGVKDEVEGFEEVFYDSLAEANAQGVELPYELLGIAIYPFLPKWFKATNSYASEYRTIYSI